MVLKLQTAKLLFHGGMHNQLKAEQQSHENEVSQSTYVILGKLSSRSDWG